MTLIRQTLIDELSGGTIVVFTCLTVNRLRKLVSREISYNVVLV